MKFKNEISLGEMLTAVSILITAISLTLSWKKERQIEIANRAEEIRATAIEAYSKVQYWKDLNVLLFDKADELIMDVTIEYAVDNDVVLMRDRYWKGLLKLRNELEEATIKQDLRTFHLTMLKNGLDRDSVFISTVAYLDKMTGFIINDYIEETDGVILPESQNKPFAEVMGNKLRGVNFRYQSKVMDLFRVKSKALKTRITFITDQTDNDLAGN